MKYESAVQYLKYQIEKVDLDIKDAKRRKEDIVAELDAETDNLEALWLSRDMYLAELDKLGGIYEPKD